MSLSSHKSSLVRLGQGREWRVLVDLEGDIRFQMARDEALFEACSANLSPPTVRLYRCRQPSVTLGRFQDMGRTLHTEALEREGVVITRRISGGRGILHGDDLILSVTGTVEDLGFESARVVDLYYRLADVYKEALMAMGMRVGLGTCACPPKQSEIGDCFALATSADVIELEHGTKVLGAALFRRENCFLQQVSLPLNREASRFGELSRLLFRGSKRGVCEYELDADLLQERLLSAFQKVLGIGFGDAGLTPWEEAKTHELKRDRYGNTDWVRKGVSPLK